ncbi:MAG: gamma-aminobutyraldehyde dehydrogenase [Armatimonadetes bacterium]|nr:gamma-aminobutyraldehyde dehydrogenase [Armatimonadota bacterium]
MTTSYQMFINGDWVPAAAGETEPILEPATGKTLAEVPRGSEADVERAVAAAGKAFQGWADTPPKDRALALLKLADRVEEHGEELALLESRNVGKPISLARMEIPFLADNLRFFAGAARCLEGRASGEYIENLTSWIRREPVGVVGSITPWNYPLMMAVWKIAPALAAGNTVVLKPAETTPLTTIRLGELAADLLPPGVLNIITGHGQPVGAPLVRHPGVAMVSLTGDVATGKEVARTAADSLKKVHLELGGKAPVLVFEDADLEAVADTLRFAGYCNSGQDCTAACRVYAPKSVYDRLLEALEPRVKSIQCGDVGLEETEMGPIVSERQRSRVAGFVERAAESPHIEILTGGRIREGAGFYYEPTLIAGARQQDEIVRREVFGPVVTVTRFEDDEEAIRWANDTDYGLTASVWTQRVDRALEISRRLRFGAVWINDHMTLVSEMPHGGYKQSGYGKDLSMYGLEDYTQVKHVMARFRR